LFVNLGSLDEGIKNIENAVAPPGVRCFAEDLDFFFVAPLARGAISVGAEGVKLVDELVDDIPGPVVLLSELDLAGTADLAGAHRRRFEVNGSI
jgi:hypothetical protein